MSRPTQIRIACIWFTIPTDLTEFAEACLRFSPQICLRSNQALFIEIGKSNTLFTETLFLKRVQVLLKRFNLKARGAVRSNLIDALLAAHYGTDLITDIPLESLRLLADPFDLQAEQKEGAVTSRAVSRMIESFWQLGLRTLEDFFNLPVHELASRFGSIALVCRHHLERPNLTWPKWAPREVIEETLELSYDDYCSTLEPLIFKSKQILDRLFARLKGRGLRLSRMQVMFYLERFSTVRKPVHEWDFDLTLPQGSTSGVIPILQERWDRDLQKEPLETSVLKIHLVVKETAFGYEGQRNFFHEKEEQHEKLNAVIGQLAETLGADKVFRVSLVESRLPELSWKKRFEERKPQPIDFNDHVPLRPTRLLSAPQLIEVSNDQIFFRKRIYTIKRRSEIEKISCDWLNTTVARKYCVVDINEGPSLWIYQENDRYFLHGYYE